MKILYNLNIKLLTINKYTYLGVIYNYKNIIYFIISFTRIVKVLPIIIL